MTTGCMGCAFLHVIGKNGAGLKYCDYVSKTGHTRLGQGVKTDPGGGCRLKDLRRLPRKPVPITYGRTADPPKPLLSGRAPKEKKRRLRPAEHQRRLALWKAGHNDADIARMAGLTAGAIWQWRRDNRLPANCAAGRPKKRKGATS